MNRKNVNVVYLM
jgi:hypothetical protein